MNQDRIIRCLSLSPPKENPKIAVSVYVEYSGQGARAAASIASLMIEKYLFGTTKRPYVEEYVLKGDFLD